MKRKCKECGSEVKFIYEKLNMYFCKNCRRALRDNEVEQL